MALPKLADVIDGRYRLLQKLGAGAHGVVYRARDLETRDDVALKFLSDDLESHSMYVERLRREALAMAQLEGTAAVKVFALNQSAGHTYLVMEYLKGMDLATYLQKGEESGGQFRSDYLLTMLRPIVHTLDIAHQKGIVHRDLKPSNIYKLDKSVGGGVRLLDFGLVKLLAKSQITSQGQVAGTPSYIAPEAWRGQPQDLDHRIDVYSLGVLVYRCLTGKVPYEYTSVPDLLQWALAGERPGLRVLRGDLPEAIDAWTARALAIDPDRRFQSVRALWDELEVLLGTRA